MTTQSFSNNFTTIIAKDVRTTDTNIFLAKIGGLPSIPSEGFFKITFVRLSDGAREVCKVLNVNSINSSIEVQRAQENTLALKLSQGDIVSHNLTAQTLNDYSLLIDNLSEKLDEAESGLFTKATETSKGVVEIATIAEANALTSDDHVMTAYKVKDVLSKQTDYGIVSRYNETIYSETILVDGDYTVNRGNGGTQILTFDAAVTSTNVLFDMTSGESVTLRLIDADVVTFNWGSVVWVNDTTPTLTGDDFVEFLNILGVVYGFVGATAAAPTGSGLFVAVGSNSSIVTSPDGITWTPQSVPSTSQGYRAIYWSQSLGKIVVASGSNSDMVTSVDGTNWVNEGAPGVTALYWFSYSPTLDLYVATRTFGGNTNGNIATSNDGLNWTVPSTILSNNWRKIIWVDELSLFVVASQRAHNFCIYTSPNGTSWSVRAAPSPVVGAPSVAWSPELSRIVVVGDNGSIGYSSDAINWTLSTIPSTSAVWSDVTWSPSLGLFVAVSRSGVVNERVATSPDGITWTYRPTPGDSNDWRVITWSPTVGLFAATGVGGTNNNIMTSPDGINWTLIDTTGFDDSKFGIIWAEGVI